MAAGAAGFLEKQTSAEVLTKAVHSVANGVSFFSPAIARRMAASKTKAVRRDGISKPASSRLTSRETEVLQLVAEGHANKQVAASLDISIKTVEKHRQRLMDKLNIHETAGLTRYAISHRIIESGVQVTHSLAAQRGSGRRGTTWTVSQPFPSQARAIPRGSPTWGGRCGRPAGTQAAANAKARRGPL